MPRGIYSDIQCKDIHSNLFTPQEHQKFVQEWFIKTPHKGLLLFHKLGSGKTCSSIIIADALLKLKDSSYDKVYVLTPGSLRQGWIDEYCGVCGENNELLKKYTFITYNYGEVYKYLPSNKDLFDNSIVIIDEVHNFINNVKNMSKNAVIIYEKLLKSNCKILALSGTPIYDNIYEWSYLGNLLKPRAFPYVVVYNTIEKEKFLELFYLDYDGSVFPKDPESFNNAMSGIISFFPGVEGKYYPEVVELPIIKTLMTKEQESTFKIVLEKEETIIRICKGKNKRRSKINPTMCMIANKRIMSRGVSNFYYPPTIYSQSEDDFSGENKKKPDLLKPKGWIDRIYFKDNQLKMIYSPKMTELFKNILNNYNSKHMVFSFFKEKSGLYLIKSLFDMCGISSRLFTGDLNDKQRQKLLEEYNDPNNRYGEKIRVILVSDAGAEGITLRETGHIHILESDTRENKIQQAIGRAVRYKSHINMPENEQKVYVWRYWSVSNNMECIDEMLYNKGMQKLKIFNSFIKLLIDNSIEEIYRKNKEIANPSIQKFNKRIYFPPYEDISEDIINLHDYFDMDGLNNLKQSWSVISDKQPNKLSKQFTESFKKYSREKFDGTMYNEKINNNKYLLYKINTDKILAFTFICQYITYFYTDYDPELKIYELKIYRQLYDYITETYTTEEEWESLFTEEERKLDLPEQVYICMANLLIKGFKTKYGFFQLVEGPQV
jgi:superfamily II DNA or RNA helicase